MQSLRALRTSAPKNESAGALEDYDPAPFANPAIFERLSWQRQIVGTTEAIEGKRIGKPARFQDVAKRRV